MAQFTTAAPVAMQRKPGASRQTAGYFAAFIALGLTTASLGPTLPALAEMTRATLSAISFVVAARSIGFLIGSLVGGRLYDRFSGHRVMAAMLVLIAAMMAVVPLAANVWLLALMMMMLGTAESALDVGGNTLLVWAHASRVGPFMNGLHFFFGVGATLSPIIVAQAFLLRRDVGLSYWILALVILPVAAYLARVPAPAPQAVSESDSARMIDYKTVALVALFLFLYLGAELGFGNWIYSYARAFQMDKATAAYLTSTFWGSLMVGRLLAIPIAARFEPRIILLTDLGGCLTSVAVAMLWKDSSVAIWIATFGIGLSMASIFPTTLTFAERRIPITGRVTGWFLVGASAGGATVPWLIGQAFESLGPRILLYAVMTDLIAASIVLAVLIFRSPKHGASRKAAL